MCWNKSPEKERNRNRKAYARNSCTPTSSSVPLRLTPFFNRKGRKEFVLLEIPLWSISIQNIAAGVCKNEVGVVQASGGR